LRNVDYSKENNLEKFVVEDHLYATEIFRKQEIHMKATYQYYQAIVNSYESKKKQIEFFLENPDIAQKILGDKEDGVNNFQNNDGVFIIILLINIQIVLKNLQKQIKRKTYEKYWNNGQKISNDKFIYPENFQNYWDERKQFNHKGKIIYNFVQRFGKEIIKNEFNLAHFFRTPIDLLPSVIDTVEKNLTNKAKSILKSEPT
jgi:hypothetical protein